MVKKVAVKVQNMQTGFIALANMWKTHQHLLLARAHDPEVHL